MNTAAQTTTKTQQRAECAACRRDQAVNAAGRMVHHGYKVAGYGYFVGSCGGTRQPHFGTPEGRDLRTAVVAGIRRYAEGERTLAAKVRSGESPVMTTEYRAGRRFPVEMKDPAPWQRESYAKGIEHRAQMAERDANDLEKTVLAWVAKAPRDVVTP